MKFFKSFFSATATGGKLVYFICNLRKFLIVFISRVKLEFYASGVG